MLETISGQVVTATAFVRNFGAYSRSAGLHPVHILNHGRPAWALVSADYLASLARADGGGADNALDLFVDAIAIGVIQTDEALRIIRTNAQARRDLSIGAESLQHVPLSRVLADYKLVLQAAERVLNSGMPEEMDVDMVGAGLRTFRVRIEKFGAGVSILIEEMTAKIIAREQHEKAAGYETLIDALPNLARGTINGRGLVSAASQHLADLVRSSSERIIGIRLSALFHSSSRASVTDAVEGLLAERKAFTITAQFQADGNNVIPVSLTAIPSLSGHTDDRGIFLISQGTVDGEGSRSL